MKLTKKRGFALLEVLVVVIIIAILASVAVPQYQKAVLKSRYSTLMPIGKTLAESNEVYYLENGSYAQNTQDLPIQGKANYENGTKIAMIDDKDSMSYVRVTHEQVPNARYLVYQKHSKNFADTTQCEAGDERTKELCQALGGQELAGNSGGEDGWTAYLLSGSLRAGDHFITQEEKLQAMVNEKCAGCTWFSNNDGTVTVCGSHSEVRGNNCYPTNPCQGQSGVCVAYAPYKYIYDTTGRIVKVYACSSLTNMLCNSTTIRSYTYNNDGSYSQQSRQCYSRVTACSGNKGGSDVTYNAAGQQMSDYTCVAGCNTYSSMKEWSEDRSQTRTCTQINGKTCTMWSDWQ